MAKNYKHPRYTDKGVLNKTIENINRSEQATDYVLDFYTNELGKTPSMIYLRKQRENLERWLFKDNELINNLKIALSYLNFIGLDIYLEDYLQTRR